MQAKFREQIGDGQKLSPREESGVGNIGDQ